MTKFKLLAVAVASVSLHALAAPAPVTDVSSNTLSVQERLTVLERKLEARNRSQITIQRQLDEIQQEVNELRGVTELHSHQLSQVIARQRELYQELERRVTEALAVNQTPAATINTEANSSEAVSYSDNLSENQRYDKAVNLVLKDKRYDQAIAEFQQFNQQFPQSSYAPNAHYWLGQLLYTKGKLTEAKTEFEQVTQYEQSSKRGDAILKLALIASKQGDDSRAKQLYQRVIAEYPDTSLAQLAQDRLSSQGQ